jgi:hypothetical protein
LLKLKVPGVVSTRLVVKPAPFSEIEEIAMSRKDRGSIVKLPPKAFAVVLTEKL